MKTAPLPANENERLQALHRYDVLDTQPEKDFNDLTRVAAQVCGTPMAAITFVDERRQWFKSRVGLPFNETPRHISFCSHAILERDLFLVPDASTDERFHDNPLVIESPHLRFFAGMPLQSPDGFTLGTLAVMDRQVRQLTPEQTDMLRVLARQVMTQLELRRNLVELARSVEDHKLMEEQLRNSEVFYHTLVESLPQSIFRKDAAGRFTFANQRFCDNLKRPLHEILGKDDRDFFPGHLADKYRVDDKRVMDSGEALDTVEAYQTPAGETRYMHVIKTPLYDAQGAIAGIQGIFWDVTVRKRIEEALAYERDLLRGLLDSIPDRIFFKDRDSRFIRCSASQARRLGLSDPGEIVGKTDFDFYPREVAQQFYEDEQNILRTGEPVVNKQQHHLDREGHETWSSVTKVPIRNQSGGITGIIGLTRDITKLIRAEHALRHAEEKYRAIYENAVEGIFQTTPDGHYISANPALARLYGYNTPEELMADVTNIEQELYVQPGRREEFKKLMQDQGRVVGFESEIFRADRSKIWISEAARAVRDEKGNISYYEGAVEDITLRKNVERDREGARQAALESARIKAQFLANMSHEIRTPMNAILGMAGLLNDTRLDAEQREFVEIIRTSTHALLDIINDVLDFSKMEAGKLQIETIPFDLREVVESTVELLAVQAHRKELELACWIEQDVATRLLGDPARLRQILTNLVNNAVKFTERGEVVVKVTRTGPGGAAQRLRFEVRDTGIGIDAGTLERIFQEFTQADGSTTRKYGGTGLGLTISKQLVELMGGTIGVESAPSQGSIFWFELPFAPDPAAAAAPAQPVEFLAGRRILVVDDHAIQREILHRQLQAWQADDAQTTSSHDALEMLHAAATTKRPFEIAIIDQDLPDLKGVELARTIKSDPALTGVRVVMLTSLGCHLNAEELKADGIAACLIKPPRQIRLRECLEQAMSGPGAEISAPLTAASVLTPRILLAEDNAVNQRVALAQLKKLGHEARAVSNGIEVLDALQQERFDIVLMDCQMPEMDGYETAQRIRAGAAGPRYHGGDSPYIIALTANAMEGDRDRCLAVGMNDYLEKPLHPRSLDAALVRAMSPRATASVSPAPADGTAPCATLDRLVIASLRGSVDPGQPDPLNELIQLFLEDSATRINRIEVALKSGDTAVAAAAAHTIKGSASNLGAQKLAKLLLELEKLVKAGALEAARESFPTVKAEFEKVRTILETEVAPPQANGI